MACPISPLQKEPPLWFLILRTFPLQGLSQEYTWNFLLCKVGVVIQTDSFSKQITSDI